MYADFTCRVLRGKHHTAIIRVIWLSKREIRSGTVFAHTLCCRSRCLRENLCGGGPSKNTAFDLKTEGRSQCLFSITGQPPSVSSVSLRLLRMQVKIGVSRSV